MDNITDCNPFLLTYQVEIALKMDRNSVTDIKSDVHSLLRWISDASLIRISQNRPRNYAKKPTNSWAKQSKLDEISSDQVYITNFGSINLP